MRGFQVINYGSLFLALLVETPFELSAQEPVVVVQKRNEVALESGFQWLFDGKSMDGWEGNKEWFRIEEGCVVAGSLQKRIPHNEFLCTTKQYEDFELKLEVRLKGQGDNAGVQFRTVRIPNNSEVSGFQCDVGNAFGGPVWGALYDESRRRKMLAQGEKEQVEKWLKKDDWNELTVKADKDRIQIWLNGHQTVDYTEKDASISRTGIIGLQIHSGPPTEAWYRNIRIKVL